VLEIYKLAKQQCLATNIIKPIIFEWKLRIHYKSPQQKEFFTEKEPKN